MFRLLIVSALIGLATAAGAAEPAAAPSIKLLDRIVAVVNSDVITQYQLDDRVKTVSQQLRKQNIQLPPREILDKQVLDRMILEQVQLQLAKETGIRVDDTQLDKALQRIAEQNKMDLASFRKTLEHDHVDFDKFREEIRNEIIISRLRERDVDNHVQVSEGEVDNYLKTRAAIRGSDNEYNLAHILISVPEQASPEQIQARKAKAEAALDDLRKGTNFSQVSARYSDASDAMDGGLLGWRSAARLPSLFVEAAEALQPGGVSGLLRSPNGFHIIKLLDKRGKDTPMIVQQTHARHILIKINELTSETDAKNRLLQLRERLVNGAKFSELARLHSEDVSASQGGDLGWLSPGQTVPEFERAMDELKPGQISQPVRTPFGWHLIQVLERRTQDVSQQNRRLQAQQEIRARKADEAYQDWLRQLRDRAYVEYRLDDKS
ncbi:MAG: peptidylprolyl isomerase [Sulfuricellaceae bacterium]|nr:peptidylprolyl isomerase [Sulfuricellaceae bacterium]